VIDALGRGVVDARIEVTAVSVDGKSRRAGLVFSRAEGTFVIPALVSGRYRLSVSDDLHAPHVHELTIEDGDGSLAPVELRLAPGKRIAGRVTREGAPAADAVVTVELPWDPDAAPWQREPRRAFTDAKGRFEIGGLATGSIKVSAKGARAASKARGIELSDGSFDNLELELEATGTIAGLVVDSKGNPLSEAVVEGRGILEPGPWAKGPVVTARSDGAGRFVMQGVGPGRYRLIAARRGPRIEGPWPLANARAVTAGDQDVRLELAGPGVLTGQVVEWDGRPVQSFVVEIDGIPRQFDAQDGRFRHDGVPPGGHEVRFRLPGRTIYERRSIIVSTDEETDAGTVTLAPTVK
jgi:hypothetical protein